MKNFHWINIFYLSDSYVWIKERLLFDQVITTQYIAFAWREQLSQMIKSNVNEYFNLAKKIIEMEMLI